MKNTLLNVGGFPVKVYQGKEVTDNQIIEGHLQAEVITKVNGPHHDAKWAIHLRRPMVFPQVIDTRRMEPVYGSVFKSIIAHRKVGHLTVRC